MSNYSILIFLLLVSNLAYSSYKEKIKVVKNYYHQIDPLYSKYVEKHLKRDSKKCAPHPKYIKKLDRYFSKKYTRNNPKVIKGRIRYLGFVPGKYLYKVYWEKDTLTVQADIRVKNLKRVSRDDLKKLQVKFDSAARYFGHSQKFTFPVKFEFGITEEKKHVKTKIVSRHSRGPYFWRWSLKNSRNTHAHEFAHVMGLDDEYKNRPFNPSSKHCNQKSIMCKSRQGVALDYHYYVILRRVFC
ncbi:hypothetical protein N9N67_04490 [Bacteriovoracaceae bacterium]|nr:hypothetical protein [Bacteriovoracaceae bacterium]